MNATSVNNQVQLICPTCKSKKELKLPESILNQSGQLTTISVPNGLVCNHHFQAFVDQQFKVRGYQRVDFEIKQENATTKTTEEDYDTLNNVDSDFYDNLILEGNYLEYKPKNNKNPILDEASLNGSNLKDNIDIKDLSDIIEISFKNILKIDYYRKLIIKIRF